MNLDKKVDLRQQVIDMAKAGIRPALIAERLECEPAQIHGLINYERRKGLDIPNFPTGPVLGSTLGRRLTLDARVVRKLEAQAATRRMSPNDLAERIVTTVMEDDLLNAVLDDGGANG